MLNDLSSFNNEMVEIDGKLYQLKCELLPFFDMDKKVIHKLHDEFIKDKKASLGMELMKIPIENQLEQYGMCNYGGFDNQPDIIGDETHAELYDCGKRGQCPGEGLVCKSMKTEYGLLSPKCIKYLQYACLGLKEKEIAIEMGIAVTTAQTYKERCMLAANVSSKPALVSWAKDKNIA